MVMIIRMHSLPSATPVLSSSRKPKGLSEGQIPRFTESLTHDLNSTGRQSCCEIAREYIESGHSADTPIHFVSGETRVFAKDSTLEWWASREILESDAEHWMRIKKRTGNNE